MKHANHDNLEADPTGIELCQPRLALSASLAGELLFDALGVQAATTVDAELVSESTEQAIGDVATEEVANEDAAIGDVAGESFPSRSPEPSLSPEFGQLDGSGQTIAVIDSGVAWDHVRLGGGYGPGYRVVGGWDFAENDANPYDDGPAGYHGTHVAGLIADGSNDGITASATGADIVALRVFDDAGQSELQWVESALRWVHENQDTFESPITTVNLSVGAALGETLRAEAMATLEDELVLLRQDNILVFAAAGNFYSELEAGGTDDLMYPAASDNVVAVTSVDATGNLSEFAQREPGILAAPGEAISSSVPDHVYGWDGKVDDLAELDGTSMAAPQAAAASMLLRQAMNEAGLDPTADQILSVLYEGASRHMDAVTDTEFQVVDWQQAVRDVQDNIAIDNNESATPGLAIPVDDRLKVESDTSVGGPADVVVPSHDESKLPFDFDPLCTYDLTEELTSAEIVEESRDDSAPIDHPIPMVYGPIYPGSSFEIVALENASGDDRIDAEGSGASWDTSSDHLAWTGVDEELCFAVGSERSQAFDQFEPIQLPALTSEPAWPWGAPTTVQEADASRAIFASLGDS